MANKVTISVGFQAVAEDLRKLQNSLKGAISNVNPESQLSKTLSSKLKAFQKEMDKYSDLTGGEFIDASEIKASEKSFRNLIRLADSFFETYSSIQMEDIFADSIDESNELVKNVRALEVNLQKAANELKAIKNTSIKDVFGADKGVMADLKRIDIKGNLRITDSAAEAKKGISNLKKELDSLQQDLTSDQDKNNSIDEVIRSLEQAQKLIDQVSLNKKSGGGFKSNKDIVNEITDLISENFSDISKWEFADANSKIVAENILSSLGLDKAAIEALPIEDRVEAIKNKIQESISGQKNRKEALSTVKTKITSGLSSAIADEESEKINTENLENEINDIQELIKRLQTLLVILEAKSSEVITQANNYAKNELNTAKKQLNEATEALKNAPEGINQELINYREGSKSVLEQGQGVASERGRDDITAKEEAEDFRKSLQFAIKQWFSLHEVITRVKDGVRQAYQEIKNLDSAMANIAVVTDMSIDELWGKIDEYMAIARQYGVTTQGVYEVSQLYYQQGLNQKEVTELTTETLKLARVANMDYAASADAMTVALRGFNMEMSQAATVTDVYSEVAAITASDQEELAIAMSKTASSAASVGSSFENTTAMLAVMVETTRESAQNLGSALKSIISRYGEMKVGVTVDSEGEELDYNKVDTALKSVGISLKDTQGQFRDFDDVIFELSAKWDTLDKNTQRYIATIMAGNRQQSRFIALVDNWERLQEVSEAAMDSEDAGLLQYSKTLDSLETKLNNISTSFQQFYMNVINGPVVGFFLDIVNKILEGFNKLGNWQSILNIAGLIISIKNISTLLVNGFSSSFSNIIAQYKASMKQMVSIARISGAEAKNAYSEGWQRGPSIETSNINNDNKTNTPWTSTKVGRTVALSGTALSLIGTSIGSALAEKSQFQSSLVSSLGNIGTGISIGAQFGPYGAIVGAIVGLVASIPALANALDANTRAEEKLAQLQEESEKKNIERAEKKNEYKNLQALLKEYDSAQKSRYNSDEDYQNWIDVNNQLVEAYPELIGYIDEEGNAIADVTNATEILKQSMISAAEASRAYYKAKVDEIQQTIVFNRDYTYGISIGDFSVIHSIASEKKASYLRELINFRGINSAEFTNEELYNWLKGKDYEITDFANYDKSTNDDIKIIGEILKSFKVIEKNIQGYYEANQSYVNYQNAKKDENLLETYSKSSATSNLSLLSSYEDFDDNVQTISGYQSLLYTLIGNMQGMTDEKISELTLESNEWTQAIETLESFYGKLSSANQEIFSSLYNNIGEYSLDNLKFILENSLKLDSTSEIYKAIIEEWYNKNYKEGFNSAKALESIYNVSLDSILDYDEYLIKLELSNSPENKENYETDLRKQITSISSDLANVIFNLSDSTLDSYSSYIQEEQKLIESGEAGSDVAEKRKNYIKQIIDGLAAGNDNLSKFFEDNAELATEFYSLLFTEVGTYNWAKNIIQFAERNQVPIDTNNIEQLVYELYPTVVNSLEETVTSVVESVDDYLSMQKDGWEIGKAESFAKILNKNVGDIFTNVGGKIILRSTDSIIEWYNAQLTDIQNRLAVARQNEGDLGKEEIAALQEKEQLVLNQMNQAMIDLHEEAINSIKNLTSILSGSISGSMDLENIIDLGTHMQTQGGWNPTQWANFQSKHISQLPSGEFQIDFEGIAELATELDLVGAVWEDLVDSFESIEDVENMWKDLGDSIDGATKVILKNIEAIKRADAGDAMFDFMGQDMDSYADTYKTMAENLDDWSGVMTEAMEKGTMGIADFWNISRVMNKTLTGEALTAWNDYAQAVMASAKTTEGGIVAIEGTVGNFGTGLEVMKAGMQDYYKELANEQIKVIDAQIAALKAQEAAEKAIKDGQTVSIDSLIYTGGDDIGLFSQEDVNLAKDLMKDDWLLKPLKKDKIQARTIDGDVTAGVAKQYASDEDFAKLYQEVLTEALNKGLDTTSVEVQQMIHDSTLARAGLEDYSDSLKEVTNTNELLSNIDANVTAIAEEVNPEKAQAVGGGGNNTTIATTTGEANADESIDQLNGEISKLSADLAALEAEKAALINERDATKAALVVAEQNYQNLNNSINNPLGIPLDEYITSLLTNIETLNAIITSKQAEIDSLTSQLATANGNTLEAKTATAKTDLNPPKTDTQDSEEAGAQAAEEYKADFEATITENPPTTPIEADTTKAEDEIDQLIKSANEAAATINIFVRYHREEDGSISSNTGGTNIPAEELYELINDAQYAGNVSGLALYNGTNLANKTLVGELGPELAVYDNMYHLLGQNGAEFVNLPDDAIVFNHRQTKGIIRGQAGYRGKALVNGNVSGPAYASGTSAAIQKLEEAKAMWQAIADMDVESLLGAADSGGGGGGGNTIKAHIEDLEEWYNLLRQIENLEQKITNIQAERANIIDGHEYLRSLREEQSLLEKQVTTQEILLDYQQKQLKLQADQINNNKIWSQFLTVGSDGLLQYKKGNEANGGKGALEVLQDLNEMSGKEQQAFMKKIGYSYTTTDGDKLEGEELVAKFYEELQAQIDAYDELYDTVNETEGELENLETSINDINEEIRQNQMDLETAIYETLVEMREKEISQLEEQVDLIKEANDAYIDGIQKAIQAERDLYEKNKTISDREQLQRRLSLLRMSGGSASEIADLEAQLDETLKNEYFSRQEESLSAIQDASEKQIERLDNQIRIMEENLAYQKENGLLWQQVYDIMASGETAITDFLKNGNSKFFEASALEQQNMLVQWAKMVGIYKEDQAYKYYEETGKSIWDKDYTTNASLSGLTDSQRATVSDEFSAAYAKHMLEGMSSEEATKAAWNDVQKTISNMKSQNQESEKKNNSGSTSSGTNSSSDSTASKYYSVTVSAGNGGGSPTLSTDRTTKTTLSVYAGRSITINPNPGARSIASYATVNGKKISGWSFSAPAKNTKVVVYYERMTGDPDVDGTYAKGGIIPEDQIAQVHEGEGVLDAKQTPAFIEMVENYRKLSRFNNPLLSFIQSHKDSLSSKINNNSNGGDTITIAPGAVQIAVAELNDKYDVEELANDVMNRMVVIANKATNRGVNRR